MPSATEGRAAAAPPVERPCGGADKQGRPEGWWESKTVQRRLTLPEGGFALQGGSALPEVTLAYEEYGTLDANGSNAVFICHALTGDAHAAGWHEGDARPGWWDPLVGPGKAVDTNRFYVVCANILGGCMGSTGPNSINPETGRKYGVDFPLLSIADTVEAEFLLLQELGVRRLAIVMGGSMGGMRTLQWAVSYPDFVQRCICVATGANLTPQALAFNVIARSAIENDPDWQSGNYYNDGSAGDGSPTCPDVGLGRARQLAHITYLSSASMQRKFGREVREGPLPYRQSRFSGGFQVESYLEYQGNKFAKRFDANSYLHITRMVDQFDLAEGGLSRALSKVKAKFLVVAISSDWLFPPEQQIEIVTALLSNKTDVSFFQVESAAGHDGFLLHYDIISKGVAAFLAPTDSPATPLRDIWQREDREHLCQMVERGSHILDVGAGDGRMMKTLGRRRFATGVCVDVDFEAVASCMRQGLPALQLDADMALSCIPADTFDVVMFNHIIQQLRSPLLAIQQMLRIAPLGIIGFPNFAYYRHRLSVALGGHLPVSQSLPYEWYETPNVHVVTCGDFFRLCHRHSIHVLEYVGLADSWLGNLLLRLGLYNLGSERTIVKVTAASAT